MMTAHLHPRRGPLLIVHRTIDGGANSSACGILPMHNEHSYRNNPEPFLKGLTTSPRLFISSPGGPSELVFYCTSTVTPEILLGAGYFAVCCSMTLHFLPVVKTQNCGPHQNCSSHNRSSSNCYFRYPVRFKHLGWHLHWSYIPFEIKNNKHIPYEVTWKWSFNRDQSTLPLFRFVRLVLWYASYGLIRHRLLVQRAFCGDARCISASTQPLRQGQACRVWRLCRIPFQFYHDIFS